MKTKALISFAVTAKLICVFVFAYAKCWFSYDASHFLSFELCHEETNHVKHKLDYPASEACLILETFFKYIY